jgi:hypothetical protein
MRFFRLITLPPRLARDRNDLAAPSLQWHGFAQIAVDDDDIEWLSGDFVPALVAQLQQQAQAGAP